MESIAFLPTGDLESIRVVIKPRFPFPDDFIYLNVI
jgi:hypothetical protein